MKGHHLPRRDPEFWASLDRRRLPRHVAFIMDGNGRWAKERGLDRSQGHEAGAESLRLIANCLNELGVECATFFAFSKENWRRPRSEVNALMGLLRRYLERDLREATERNMRLKVIGDRRDLGGDIRRRIADLEEETRGNAGLTLVIAVSYSGQDELERAARRMGAEIARRRLTPRQAGRMRLARYLDTAGLPDPDLLVRTSGEVRLSNFLLWQVAYAEFYFSQVHWPNFRERHLREALLQYQRRERRMGMTEEQVEAGRAP